MKTRSIANFKKVTGWMERLRSRYMYTLAAHKTFLELDRALTETYSGKKTAYNNAEIIKKYNYYFAPSKEGIRYYLIIELAKFFEVDPRKDSLTINHLLDYTEKNLKFLTKDYFKEYHKDREFLIRDIEWLEEISISEIKSFKNRIKRNKKKINDVKEYRDQYIAHDDLKKNIYTIKTRDVVTLLRLVKDVVDYYYERLESTSNIYNDFDIEPVKNTKKIFADLRKYEIIENETIKNKYREAKQ